MLTKPTASSAYLGAIWSNTANAYDQPTVKGDTTTYATGSATRAVAGSVTRGAQWSAFTAFPNGYTFSAKRLVITAQANTLINDGGAAFFAIEYFNGTSWISVAYVEVAEGAPQTYSIELGAGANESAILVRAWVTADSDGSGTSSATASMFDICIEGDVLTAPAGAGKKALAITGC